MKQNIYYLIDQGRTVSRSSSFEYVLNKTIGCRDASIWYNGHVVWMQNPAYEGDE